MSLHDQKAKELFAKYQEEQVKIFGQKIYPLSASYLIALKNGKTLNVKDYPQLKELGYWIQPADQTNLRIWSHMSQPELASKFSAITGITREQYDIGAVSSINDLWPADNDSVKG